MTTKEKLEKVRHLMKFKGYPIAAASFNDVDNVDKILKEWLAK